MMRGQFITFEGGEGSGKSTQARRLAGWLANRLPGDRNVVMTREPGGTQAAEKIRTLLLDPDLGHVGGHVESLLFFAARDDHLASVIRPALSRGDWVICDRFTDSTRAYQSETSGALVDALEQHVVGETRPDLTIILDVPAHLGLARALERAGNAAQDQFEARDVAFHEALTKAFRDIAARDPDRCVLIDGQLSPDLIEQEIIRVFSERFPSLNGER